MFPFKLITEVEIDASPETVRSVFLGFKKYGQWHPNWTINPPEGKSPIDLKPGDSLSIQMNEYSFSAQMAENTPERFAWDGSFYGVMNGTHDFIFAPSQKTPDGTTLKQAEDFNGVLAFIARPGWSFNKMVTENFENFNRSIKAEAEKVSKSEST